MAFKITCEECGAEGRIFQKKNVEVFYWALRSEGDISLSHDQEDDGDSIIIKCKNCGHELSD